MRATVPFKDRAEAGKALAERLRALQLADPVVLALPRGGVPVAVEIAIALRAPLDLVLVRKIGVPSSPEVAAAAVVDGGDPVVVYNDAVLAGAGLSREQVNARAAVELAEIERRRRLYLDGRPHVPLRDRALVLVDDGVATGASIRAAIAALERKSPGRIVLALPVGARDVLKALRAIADEVICLTVPEPFEAVGLHYRDFHQLDDAEVIRLIRAADVARMRGGAEA